MKYYQIYPNVKSKKWKGCINVDDELIFNGNEIYLDDLLKGNTDCKNFKLYFNCLADGEFTPINSLGSEFILFDSKIKGIEHVFGEDAEFISIVNKDDSSKVYYALNIFNVIDCVNWDKSEVDPWPLDYIPEDWESKRGRFFIKSVLIKDKIPKNINTFSLFEWKDAFNIIISEKIKDKILSLNFDHSFLEFHEVTAE